MSFVSLLFCKIFSFCFVCWLGLLFVHGPLCSKALSEKLFCKVEGASNYNVKKKEGHFQVVDHRMLRL